MNNFRICKIQCGKDSYKLMIPSIKFSFPYICMTDQAAFSPIMGKKKYTSDHT